MYDYYVFPFHPSISMEGKSVFDVQCFEVAGFFGFSRGRAFPSILAMGQVPRRFWRKDERDVARLGGSGGVLGVDGGFRRGDRGEFHGVVVMLDMVGDDVLSFDEVEAALMDAMEYLGRMPDRERGFLSAGSRSGWPEIIRATWLGDYGDGDAVPRGPGLTRAQVGHVERWVTGEGALVLAVPPAHRRLVGIVLRQKRHHEGGGFAWADVWRVFGDRAVTSDGLRMRYERAIRRVAMAVGQLKSAKGTICK